MSLLSKIADRLTLVPSTNPIDLGENRRELFFADTNTDTDTGLQIEAFVSTWGDFEQVSPRSRLIILKIPGTGGRAERATIHPAELLSGRQADSLLAAEVWTLNHRGYGKSAGPASMQNFVSTLEAFWRHIESKYPAEPKLITGNSLGCVSALYLAREKKGVSALLLRNPPPLAQLISTRPKYNWWSFGAAKLIAKGIPPALDAIENAKQATCPAVFVTSEKDRVVPPSYQEQIIAAYQGPTEQIILEDADHHHPPPDHQRAQYADTIDWLRIRIESLEN